jgi:hypothetical protein
MKIKIHSIDKIIYYDLTTPKSLSFYLNGFYANQKDYGYQFSVCRKKPPIFHDFSLTPIRKALLCGLGIFFCKEGEEEFYFCIDRGDHADNSRKEGYDLTVLKRVRYYFKVNYNPKAIESDPELAPHRAKIFPITPGFPLRVPRFSFYIPRWLTAKPAEWTNYGPRRRIREFKNLPTLKRMRHLRNVQTHIDVFFVCFYYGQAHHSDLSEFRFNIMKELKCRSDLNAVTGFVSNKKLSAEYNDFRMKQFTPYDYLTSLARSKVAIYVRGAHNCISAKFGYSFALGLPICGQKIYNNAENLYGNGDIKKQFIYETPSQIVDGVVELLQDSPKRRKLAESNSRTFDMHYSPEIAVSRILKILISMR